MTSEGDACMARGGLSIVQTLVKALSSASGSTLGSPVNGGRVNLEHIVISWSPGGRGEGGREGVLSPALFTPYTSDCRCTYCQRHTRSRLSSRKTRH